MPTIKNVAIIGAGGNFGSELLSTLLSSNQFTLTAITRPNSTSVFSPSVKVIRVDTSSLPDLTKAFEGQDAVISTAGTAAADAQEVVIDAAIAARVYRFIPSEFGINTRKHRDSKFGKLLKHKVDNTDKLERLGREHEWFTWTAFSAGLFLDWAVNTNLLFLKPATHTARILDSGNETFSPSSLSFVARAVLRALERPEATANRYLSVAGLEVTPNQIVAAAEEIQGVKYTVEHVKSTDVLREADEKFARHDYSAFVDVLEAHLYADGAGHAAGEQGERDNEVLGLEREDLKEVLRKVLAK